MKSLCAIIEAHLEVLTISDMFGFNREDKYLSDIIPFKAEGNEVNKDKAVNAKIQLMENVIMSLISPVNTSTYRYPLHKLPG